MIFAIITTTSQSAHAWVFPEHSEITLDALMRLQASARREALNDLWRAAHDILGPQVCECPCAAWDEQTCVPLAAFVSIAGDHSCSPSDLRDIVGKQRWIFGVLKTAAEAGHALNENDVSATARIRVRHGINLDFQRSDSRYSARAVVKGPHFQLTRDYPEPAFAPPALEAYLDAALKDGQDPNASALYANFHAAAITRARQTATARAAGLPWGELAVATVMNESFAVHFLEDSFAAGHFVGTWGDNSYRIGTHDFYSGFGVDAHTWDGHVYAAYGDAFLTTLDRTRTSTAVETSFAQVLDVFGGAASPEIDELVTSTSYEGFDVCTTERIFPNLQPLAKRALIQRVMEQGPVPPSRRPSMPRSRTELGLFLGGSASVAQGLDAAQSIEGGRIANARAGFRFGYGFEAITSPRMSSQMFGEVGIVGEESSVQRVGFAARVQVPWAVIPGDGIIVLPIAAAKQDSQFWVRYAEAAGRGPFGAFSRALWWTESFSLTLSALTDCSLLWFPKHRAEIMEPILSFRAALPLTWVVATDGLIDLGTMQIWDDNLPKWHNGVFVSISGATRVFP